MIKFINKFIGVFLLVGIGQALALWFLAFITSEFDSVTVNEIAKMDVAFTLLFSTLTLGVGQYFTRYLMVDESYESALESVRSFRLLLGVLLSLAGIILYAAGETIYGAVLSSAVFLSLSVEFALYARGSQVSGALASFIKVSGGYLFFAIVVVFLGNIDQKNVAGLLFFSIVSFSIIAAVFSLHVVGKNITFKFTVPSRDVFIGVFQLGGAFYLYSSVKNLALPIADYISDGLFTTDFYIFLKLYFLIFSVRRVFVQIVLRWLISSKVTWLINSVYFLISAVAAVVYALTDNLLSIDLFHYLLGLNVAYPYTVILLALSLSLFSVYPSRLLVLHGDNLYKRIYVSLSVVFVFCLYLSIKSGGILMFSLLASCFELLIGLSCFLGVLKYGRK